MINKEIEIQLKKYGYDRKNKDYHIENDTICEESYKDETLNHSILSNCKIRHVNFDNASATGSIFRTCKFLNCYIMQTDFEFCSFNNCYFKSTSKTIASFNNTNFINTVFENMNFEFCTFTGALFENCIFKSVRIANSTLENAVFKNCIFQNMNLGDLNMDFVEIEQPVMNNVKLPFSQISYMFGCLQYIFSTHDNILVTSQNGNVISVEEYKEHAIPLLIEFWESNKNKETEFFFPLANVYIAKSDYNNAVINLRDGLKNAVIEHDFRLIKFYCKLISKSGLFNSSALYNFYNIIKRFGTTNGNISLPEMKNFIRNIGEIENSLFSSCNNGKLFLRFRSNLSTDNTEKLGIIIGKIFSFSKMKHTIHPNTIEMSLTENSPLMISLQITGDAENLVTLLNAFFIITKLSQDQAFSLNFQSSYIVKNEQQLTTTIEDATTILNICNEYKVELFLIEYFIENCAEILSETAQTYYYFNNVNYWENYKKQIE